MSRKLTREIIMNTIYQMDIHNEFTLTAFESYLNDNLTTEKDLTYAKSVVNYFTEHHEMIDEQITAHLKNWTIDRISKVDLAILRLALSEMKCIKDVTPPVAINEAVNLAKRYSDDESSQFINGVLGEIIKHFDEV